MALVHCFAIYRDGLLQSAQWFAQAESRDAHALRLPRGALQPGDVVCEWRDLTPDGCYMAEDITRHVQDVATCRDYTPSARYTVPEPQSGR